MPLHSQRLTAAAALAPPQPGMYLVRVTTIGGATPGSWSLNYDGQSVAHFAAPTNGTATYHVNHLIRGTNVAASTNAFNGGIVAVMLVYATNPTGGPPMRYYRAIRFARTDAGATTANVEVAYDVGPSTPLRANVLISASTGRVIFPAMGSLEARCEANAEERNEPDWLAPELPAANNLSLSVITDGAATIQALVFY